MSNPFGLIKAFGMELSKDQIRHLGRNKNGDDVYGILTSQGLIPATFINKVVTMVWKQPKTHRSKCRCECHDLAPFFALVDHYGEYCCVPDDVEIEEKQYILNLMQ